MTHKALVCAAHKWVLKNTSCGVAIKELSTSALNGEYPDVIAFGAGGHSILIECKSSRADFHADKKKKFRINPETGMGSQRFYCCPENLIDTAEIPEGWGLLYVDEKSKVTCIHQPYKGNIGERKPNFQKHIIAEHGLMYSVLRRLQKKGLLTDF